jgi:hypothetical protein
MREFVQFCDENNGELRFVVIEHFILYLTRIKNDHYKGDWDDLITEVKKKMNKKEIDLIKAIGLFLNQKWTISSRSYNFRQIRNQIVHPSEIPINAQELSMIFEKLKERFLEENKDNLKENSILSNLDQLNTFKKRLSQVD